MTAYCSRMPALATRRQFRARREITSEMRKSRWRHRTTSGGDLDFNAAYGDGVDPANDPRLLAFARFITRALDDARAAGLSIADVEKKTGLGRSTIYRWKRREVSTPQPTQVQQFCKGLGIPVRDAARTLGWNGGRVPVDPEPPMDDDVRTILRMLADPKIGEADKMFIRETLRMLARRPISRGRDVTG